MGDTQQFYFDDSGIRNLLAAMESEHSVYVGIFGGDHVAAGEKKKSPNKMGGRKVGHFGSGMTNAEVGFMLEYGSKLRKQPARSWLIAPITQGIERIVKRVGNAFEDCAKTATPILFLKKLGIAAEAEIEIAFDQGGPGWAANAPSTIARKGSSSPGIDTGQLRRAVASQVV